MGRNTDGSHIESVNSVLNMDHGNQEACLYDDFVSHEQTETPHFFTL